VFIECIDRMRSSFEGVFDNTVSGHIAGLPGSQGGPIAFLSSGNLTAFNVNFSRKILLYYHTICTPVLLF